ncbi:M23 family metallopeptidase [Bowmanella dokdonensis]|uniref:Peptidoglycan DD-metalloendopeptidase family protein n=1 Tax=Bowmanella dokdonensis TaxID=751969 RepID=A0A939DK94_9ALTE|nr:M23 family metallopeptidase [Bowmanella dokdonensis]MBN7824105.1 peptidoglycan DD-metalloendopeptidase family protein [Bowmanella dokdonensis]
MSLTLVIRSQKVRLRYSLSKRQLVAALVLTLGLLLVAGRSTQDPAEARERIAYTQTGLIKQKQEVEQLKETTQQQLTGMMVKLGEMQGQLHRLNALGERLAREADLNSEEFNFSELPAIGGPAQELVDLDLQDGQDVLGRIEQMLVQLDSKTKQLDALESVLLNHHIEAQSYLAGRPVNSGWLSSYYGVRKDPFSGMPAMHKGLDFAGQEGDDVVATGAGLVTWAGERYGYGNLVEIEHGNGLVTRYGHNQELEVKVGDVVTKGQVIAVMGSTGRSTGAHVHYEVMRHGKQIDPLPFVYRKSQG